MPDTLIEMFRQTVAEHGSLASVVDGNSRLSYRQLDEQSSEIAAIVRKAGIGPGDRVGILKRKTAEAVASIWGVLKSGGAYVPLDPKWGSTRLSSILQDANMAVILVDRALSPRLQEAAGACPSWSVIDMPAGDLLVSTKTESAPAAPMTCKLSSPAYVLYTSGSTGAPKGVQHTHASALAFVQWAAAAFALSSNDRLSCHAPLHFDLTIFDLFAAARAGACVVLIPDAAALFPLEVTSIIQREKITVWYSVPFALMQLLARGKLPERQESLREVIFAGERFPPVQLRQLAQAVPKARLTNLFGPTETNVCAYYHLAAGDIESDEFCPIGQACPYASLAVVDQLGNEVSEDEIGELLVAGDSVMTGYLNRPALNDEVFVTRLNQDTPRSYFRTGDRVTAPGSKPIRFHGRIDRQVKIRGFRLELDEIEAALVNCTGVRAAAAWLQTTSDGMAELRAAVESERRDDPSALTRQIRRQLPAAAVPEEISVLTQLPRTVTGKVDYGALAKQSA
jgi:amino acid adenylation domain-containing protein